MFMIDWLFYQQDHFANTCSQGRKKFVIYDGDGISEWYEITWYHFSGRVVSAYLLTDRNYVSKSAVILEFICYLRRGWNFRVCGIVHSRKVVNNVYIDKGPVKPMHLRGGTK